MKIKVTLVAMSQSGAPSGGTHERDIEMTDGATAADVLAALKIVNPESYVTMINNLPIPQSERRGHTVKDGDVITIFPSLEGG